MFKNCKVRNFNQCIWFSALGLTEISAGFTNLPHLCNNICRIYITCDCTTTLQNYLRINFIWKKKSYWSRNRPGTARRPAPGTLWATYQYSNHSTFIKQIRLTWKWKPIYRLFGSQTNILYRLSNWLIFHILKKLFVKLLASCRFTKVEAW